MCVTTNDFHPKSIYCMVAADVSFEITIVSIVVQLFEHFEAPIVFYALSRYIIMLCEILFFIYYSVFSLFFSEFETIKNYSFFMF